MDSVEVVVPTCTLSGGAETHWVCELAESNSEKRRCLGFLAMMNAKPLRRPEGQAAQKDLADLPDPAWRWVKRVHSGDGNAHCVATTGPDTEGAMVAFTAPGVQYALHRMHKQLVLGDGAEVAISASGAAATARYVDFVCGIDGEDRGCADHPDTCGSEATCRRAAQEFIRSKFAVGATRFSARRGPESEAQEVPGTIAKKRRVDAESMVGAEVDEVVSDYFSLSVDDRDRVRMQIRGEKAAGNDAYYMYTWSDLARLSTKGFQRWMKKFVVVAAKKRGVFDPDNTDGLQRVNTYSYQLFGAASEAVFPSEIQSSTAVMSNFAAKRLKKNRRDRVRVVRKVMHHFMETQLGFSEAEGGGFLVATRAPQSRESRGY